MLTRSVEICNRETIVRHVVLEFARAICNSDGKRIARSIRPVLTKVRALELLLL